MCAKFNFTEGSLAERFTQNVMTYGVRIIFEHIKNNYSYFINICINISFIYKF